MNQDILTILDSADDFTKKVLLQGFVRNCEFWGKKASERTFEFEEKLNAAIEQEKSDDYIDYLQKELDTAQEQLTTLRKLYRAAVKSSKAE
jgi:hypothetical protein